MVSNKMAQHQFYCIKITQLHELTACIYSSLMLKMKAGTVILAGVLTVSHPEDLSLYQIHCGLVGLGSEQNAAVLMIDAVTLIHETK